MLDIDGWGLSPRGAGYLFGGDVVEKVCSVNDVHIPSFDPISYIFMLFCSSTKRTIFN